MSTPSDPLPLMEMLASFTYRYTNEQKLHEAIAEVLTDAGIAFEREVVDDSCRFDFQVGTIALEVKIGGSLSQALRQCKRYCERPSVSAVIIASTLAWGMQPREPMVTLHGTPIYVMKLRRQLF